ncbi:hypothetical protein ACFU6R_24505 [Streptomyces sp. NPDC057499]|uniref:hypothetical protein n=1 Tax=Streptomyces sp. NPDC057499 TaxID=3346150 RepID=UPI0036B26B16
MSEQPDAGSDPLARMHDSLHSMDSAVDAVESEVRGLCGDVAELRSDMRSVSAELADVSHTVERVEGSVLQLVSHFNTFTDQYAKDQARTAAEAELSRLTLEWHARFEQRRQTRALAHGLVSELTRYALERGVLDKDLVSACAQNRMLMDPSFWLGPAVVALASRHLDKARLMHHARSLAYSRDMNRSNLFFLLTCTRTGDLDEAAYWMDKYLLSIDPYALDENFQVVLDAVACGELGERAHLAARQATHKWLDRLDLAGRVSSTTEQVAQHMRDLAPELPEQNYGELRRAYTGDWDALRRGWEDASVSEATLGHLRSAFPGASGSESVGHAASALDSLIDRHDPEEAALASRIRYLRTVVEHGGDTEAAHAEHTAALAAQKPVDLQKLLVNAVFVPDSVRLGEEARQLALQALWPQIMKASGTCERRSRLLLPAEFDVAWGQWEQTLPSDPDVAVPEDPLLDEAREIVQELTRQRIEAVRHRPVRLVASVCLVTAGSVTAFAVPRGPFLSSVLAVTVAALIWLIIEWGRVPALRQELGEQGREELRSVTIGLERMLDQRVTFFAAWHDNLATTPHLEAWPQKTWQGAEAEGT